MKARTALQRQDVAAQIRVLVPQTRRAMLMGSAAWGARKALPLLQPLVLWLARKGVRTAGSGYFLKFCGVASVALTLWRLLRPDNDRNN